MNDIKVLAYYLPQFHPTPENDEWWGKGFTEWTSVAKAKPLYNGHYQPKIPADLGFYDLRLPQSRKLQAEYAQRAGISAFCYWHYWFGNGKRLLNYPLDEVIRLGEPDIPFCLAWANHTWHQKAWIANDGKFSLSASKLLIEQQYFGIEDYKNHFLTMLPCFKDRRYFKYEDKLVFVIYRPLDIPNLEEFTDVFQDLAKKNGLPAFYFIGHCFEIEHLKELQSLKELDAINLSLHHKVFPSLAKADDKIGKIIQKVKSRVSLKPQVLQYADAIKGLDSDLFDSDDIIPTLIPNWDHTPRSGNFGRVLENCSPDLFSKHIRMIFERVSRKKNKLVFLKSWNEWGEGNYMEPDLKYGTGYIDALIKEINAYRS